MILFLIFAVVFLGFAFGSARTCKQNDGWLDDKFYCHLNYTRPQNIFDVSQIQNKLDFNCSFGTPKWDQ